MKKTITILTLALVLTFGSTFSFAGIIVSDAVGGGDTKETKCGVSKDLGGIIVGDLTGIIVGDIVGIIVGDIKAAPCRDNGGIIVGDAANTGIIVGD